MDTDLKTLHEVEALEERLQVIKWTLTLGQRPKHRTTASTGIVDRTAGLLKARVSRGVAYERRIRRSWGARLKRLGL